MVLSSVAHLKAVIGCGNPNRSDDGVGPFVIGLLRDRKLPDDVALFDGGTDGMGVMYQARGCQKLIIVDARIPGDDPGAIYEVPGDVLERPPNQSLNLHDFRWDHALFAGRKIYGEDFPADVTVVLIEAKSLDMGLELSPEIAAAGAKVAKRIEALCR
ncbi:MAG: hydrogenase maturation protease [Pseudomonadota bacterium]